MGLFLGASILTLGEVAEFLVMSACMTYRVLIVKIKNVNIKH